MKAESDWYPRASAMPRAFQCPQSIRKPEGEVLTNVANDAAILGTAVHAALALHVQGQDVDVDALALEHGVEPGELGPLFHYGTKAWDELRVSFPSPLVELEVQAVVSQEGIPGHVDLLSNLGRSLILLDWKSGSVRRAYEKQLKIYALGGREFVANIIESVTCITVWLREGYYETKTYSAAELDEFEKQISTEVFDRMDTYAPGEHCGFCPRFTSCPGRTSIVKAAVNELAIMDGMTAPTPAEYGIALARALDNVRLVEGICKQARAFVKQQVKVSGPIPTKPGFALQIKEEHRDKILPLQAWPVLIRELTEDDMANCLTVRKTEMLKIIASNVAKGKGKAKAAFMDELEANGAVKDNIVESLRELPFKE